MWSFYKSVATSPSPRIDRLVVDFLHERPSTETYQLRKVLSAESCLRRLDWHLEITSSGAVDMRAVGIRSVEEGAVERSSARQNNPGVDVAARFGENLVRCRKRADMSQEELGLLSSLHRTEISLLERGTRIPRIDTLVKLAGALSVPPSELIEGIDWTPGTSTRGSFSIGDGDPRSN
jgi:ribosome-binding protein aMBF1 (putative translation factor)